MPNLGVNVYQEATKISTPRVAAVSIPYFVGAAPVHTSVKPAKAMRPVVATSWDEAVEKLGYSDDWKSYPLCEAMYSQFKLYGKQPAVFCNVLDPEKMKKAEPDKTFEVEDHKITLPEGAVNDPGLTVKTVPGTEDGAEGRTLEAEKDYSAFYDGTALVIELLEEGTAYGETSLSATYNRVDPAVVELADIVEGLGNVDECMSVTGIVPDLLLAPGWSHNTTVAAVMAAKAVAVSGLFKAKALLDCDTAEGGVREYSELTAYKNKNNFVDPSQILCWPMVRLGDKVFHMSTQLAGLMASVDTDNRGIPYESPSNKNLKMDGLCLEDGTEVVLTWPQVDLIAGAWGVVTAVNFMDQGWTAKGNYTACFPGNTDVKDQFIPVSRMFEFIGNTIIRTFWPKQDKPMTTPLVRSIIQTCNDWIGGLAGAGYLYGARAVILAAENNITEILQGHITLRVYNAPPVPAQRIDFILEYDVSYAEAAIQI